MRPSRSIRRSSPANERHWSHRAYASSCFGVLARAHAPRSRASPHTIAAGLAFTNRTTTAAALEALAGESADDLGAARARHRDLGVADVGPDPTASLVLDREGGLDHQVLDQSERAPALWPSVEAQKVTVEGRCEHAAFRGLRREPEERLPPLGRVRTGHTPEPRGLGGHGRSGFQLVEATVFVVVQIRPWDVHSV